MLQLNKFILATFEESPAWMEYFHAVQEFITPPEFFNIEWIGIIDTEVKGLALCHGASLARRFCRHQPTSSYYQSNRVAAKYGNFATWRVNGSTSVTYNVSSETPFWRKIDAFHWYAPFTSNSFIGATINGSATVIGVHNHIVSLDSNISSISSITLRNDPFSITNNLFTRAHDCHVSLGSSEAISEVAKHNSQTRPLILD